MGIFIFLLYLQSSLFTDYHKRHRLLYMYFQFCIGFFIILISYFNFISFNFNLPDLLWYAYKIYLFCKLLIFIIEKFGSKSLLPGIIFASRRIKVSDDTKQEITYVKTKKTLVKSKDSVKLIKSKIIRTDEILLVKGLASTGLITRIKKNFCVVYFNFNTVLK